MQLIVQGGASGGTVLKERGARFVKPGKRITGRVTRSQYRVTYQDKSVTVFAETVGLGSGIVVGRLQFDGVLALSR